MNAPLKIFEDAARDGTYPGAQLAVSREGRRLAVAATGVVGPGLDATHEEVLYDLASLTKPLATTVLIGRALEAGLLSLEDPLVRWFPSVDPEITITHALEHATGFPAHRRFDLQLPVNVQRGSWEAYRNIVDEAARVEREARAGVKAVYSDIGFILLGEMLERVHGVPLSTLFSALGTQLHYRDTRGAPAVAPEAIDAVTIAPTENCLPGEVHDENTRAMGGVAGHAGLFGTAVGVLELAESLLAAHHGERGRLLAPETIRRLWTPSRVAGSTRTLGWDRPSREGSSTGSRWPSHSIGHLGFTGTSVWIEPTRGLIAVLVSNRVCPTRDNTQIRTLRPRLHDAIWEAWT